MTHRHGCSSPATARSALRIERLADECRRRGPRHLPRRGGDDALLDLYAGALAVAYPPFDEDFGYVTLEAFLARKPVLTATDSGGPLEFVEDGVNGFVCPPDPRAFAEAHQPAGPPIGGRAAALGGAGYDKARAVTWDGVDRTTGWRPVTKLIIQIPCLNEADTLPSTLRDLPSSLPGIDAIEVLIVDDGSRDRTVRWHARAASRHVVRFRRNKGLASAFMAGLDAAVKLGADFIVNTDADNQYSGGDIAKLVAPLLRGDADICIGDRNMKTIAHMSAGKRFLQRLGSWVVRQVSGTTVPDTTSGFRAYTRDAALRMVIVSDFSYTLESIIHAGKRRLAIAHVEVSTNPQTRESRLFDSIFSYVKQSAATIVRIYASYEPLKVFSYIGLTIFGIGFLISLRFLYYYLTGTGLGHLQSLILSAVLMIVGFQIVLIGLVADLIAGSRKLLEDLIYRVRTLELRLIRAAAAAEPGPATPQAGGLETPPAWTGAEPPPGDAPPATAFVGSARGARRSPERWRNLRPHRW